MARVRARWGSRGAETSAADLAREMGVKRDRPWSWEAQGCWPGRDKLAGYVGRLARVREEGADPLALAKWVELGPDDKPPFDEESTGRAADPRAIDEAIGSGLGRVVMVASSLAALAKSAAAKAIVSDLLQAAKRNDRVEAERLAAAIKPLAESPAARALVARLEEEIQSVAGGLGAESFSHLLQQHDEGTTPVSVA